MNPKNADVEEAQIHTFYLACNLCYRNGLRPVQYMYNSKHFYLLNDAVKE